MKTVITSTMIAPCGMNCSICIGHLREKNKCPGCNMAGMNKPKYCITCSIKNCKELKKNNSKFCFDCSKYPCLCLRQLDKRYRTKYGMSMLENLENIRSKGIRSFVKNEKSRWMCRNCKSVLSIHRDECISCGAGRIKRSY
jgi:hypothetical protein